MAIQHIVQRQEKSDEIKSEKLTPMFQADLVEGAARCTLSGIVGFGRENLTTLKTGDPG